MNTVFYSGKIKKGNTINDLYIKLSKGIRKKGVTKNWELLVDEDDLILDFHDDRSESFVISPNAEGKFEGFCKIAFEPSPNEEIGEFESLFDALYKAKGLFTHISFSDEYGVAEDYWNSKQYQFHFRELTDGELSRWKSLYDSGITEHEKMLRTFMADEMGMTAEQFVEYINYDIDLNDPDYPAVIPSLETYLYECAAFEGKRLCEIPEQEYYDLGKVAFSLVAFTDGIAWLFLDGTGYGRSFDTKKRRAFSAKDKQVGLLFRDFFIPAYMKETDPFEKTVLVYRYYLSVLDFLGFTIVGRVKNFKYKIDEVIDEYGAETGTVFLCFYCTFVRYIADRFYINCAREDAAGYYEKWQRHMLERLGETGVSEYNSFIEKYAKYWKFRIETKYFADRKIKYIDDRLVL